MFFNIWWLIKSCPEAFFIFRDFNISEISLIVNYIIANFEFVFNSKLGGLQLLSSKFDMEQKKLFRRLHLSISSTYKISFSVSKRGEIVQLRPTLPISFLTLEDACTKSGSLRFSQFSGCWLILSVYIIMSFDFPFVRLFGVRLFCYYLYLRY